MRNIMITTDSTSDLNQELIEKNRISIVPLWVVFGGEQFRDGVDLSTHQLYEEVKKRGVLPKTAAVSVGEFYTFFKGMIEQYDCDIIHIGIGSKISASYNNAVLAAKDFEEGRIRVIDSLNLSSSIGLLLLKACKLRDEGKDIDTIVDVVTSKVPLVRCQFAIPTLDYMYKGGRCNSVTKIFGTLLKIKPIIAVRDGSLTVVKKPIGPMKKALDTLLDIIYADKDNLDPDNVMVTHTENPTDAEYLMSELKKNITVNKLNQTEAGCVISSHCGKGTIGILYILDK